MNRAHCTPSQSRRKLRSLQASALLLGLAVGVASTLPVGLPASANNPRITLSFNRANVEEVVQRLSRAADTPLWLRPLGEDQGSEDLQRIARSRATFQWRNVFFADALREVGRRWSISFGQHQDGGLALSFQEPTHNERKTIAAGEGPGWRAEVESAVRSEARLPPDYTQVEGQSIGLYIRLQTPGSHIGRIAGIGELRATDGAGRQYRRESSELATKVADGPDECYAQPSLIGPQTPKKSLASLEGVIYEYAQFEQSELETSVMVRAPGTPVFSRDKGIRLRLLSYTPQPRGSVFKGPNGPVIRCEIGVKLESAFTGEVAWGIPAFCPQLVTQSGVPFSALHTEDPNATRGGGHIFPGIRQEDGYNIQEYECWYPHLAGKPAKVKLRLVRKGQARPKMRFRIENIPLTPRPRQGS